jgi:RimJ/RimL family protein N-acetyltransferase
MPTQVTEDRETALRVGYDATDWMRPVSFQEYCESLQDWTIRAIVRDNEPIGAVYLKNDEVHFSIFPKWRGRWFTKSIMRKFFQSGKVTTKVTPGHDHIYAILERLGFKRLDDGLMVKEN